MTEEQWLTCRRADRMLRWLIAPEQVRPRWPGTSPTDLRRVSERKVRLFVCACGRNYERLLMHGDEFSRVAGDWADGRIADWEELEPRLRSIPETEAHRDLAVAPEVINNLVSQLSLVINPSLLEWLRTTFGVFHGYEADLLREVVGNPHRPPALTPAVLAWNDGTIPRLAEAIVASRSFADLPILGDALEEAGCADERLAAHCRGGGPHAPGCWALDAARGKS